MKRTLLMLYHLPQSSLILLVKSYRLLLSPWLGSACRFEPTCSAYSLQALKEYGAVAGSVLTAYRLVRCQPWCNGGHDPVPAAGKPHALFTRLLGAEPPQAALSASPSSPSLLSSSEKNPS